MTKNFWIGGKQNIIENLEKNIFLKILIDKKRKDIKSYEKYKKIKYVSRAEIEKVFAKYKNYNHQGFAALAEYKKISSIDHFFLSKNNENILAIDNIEDVGNFGTIIRSCVAFGVKFILVEKNSITQNLGLMFKNSAGYFEQINIIYSSNIYNELKKFNQNEYAITGLDANGTSELSKFNWHKKNLIIIGSEKKGVRKNILKKCDFIVSIKTNKKVESLNAAQACSISLYTLNAQTT